MNSTAQGPMPGKRQRDIYGPAPTDPRHDDDFQARVAANAAIRLIGSLVPLPTVTTETVTRNGRVMVVTTFDHRGSR